MTNSYIMEFIRYNALNMPHEHKGKLVADQVKSGVEN